LANVLHGGVCQLLGRRHSNHLDNVYGGFSIALGNSSNEVKARANAVTDSNENEGFAKAVRKFVLPPAAP
jgi:hypothetical protein